ncbi:MAG: ATP-dependent helicase [Pirellulaceae bacterium]
MFEDSSHPELLESLNPSQRKAVEHIEGPLLILAGPGSGKTRVLIHRIANMIAHGVPSHQIVAMTFTNKAADEMKQRLDDLVQEHFAWTGTFHRFCSRLLRTHATMVGLDENFTIYDHGDSKKVLKQAISDSGVPLSHHSPDQILNKISEAKSRAVTSDQYGQVAGNHLEKIAARIYPLYQRQLREANAMDFDDMLLYVVQLLRENADLRNTLDEKFRYVIVDEYQDTNTAQYLILKGLSQTHRNLAVTGDPDQSIYGWRGASLGNILDFEKDYPDVEVVRLEQNYRSTKSILGVADQLIVNNQRRKHKDLLTDNDQGIPVSLIAYPSQNQEATSIAETIAWQIRQGNRQPKDFAVFYRVNAFSRSLEHAFQSHQIPYQVVHGQEFYQRREIKDLLAYLHLLNNPNDNLAFQRIVNVPSRKIGAVTVNRLRHYADGNELTMLESARRAGLNEAMSKQAATKVAGFVSLYDRLAEHATEDVQTVLEQVLRETGYREHLLKEGTDEADERVANVDELVAAAQEFDSRHPHDGGLQAYLETAVLVNDTDAWESSDNSVTLMTLHAAKGLEFPFVFIVGLEEGTLPHERSMQDPDQLEEERRLLFVGITRAQEELQLSRALYRFRRGANWPTVASQFLMELPREQMTVIEPQSAFGYGFNSDDEFDTNQETGDDDEWFSGPSTVHVRTEPAEYSSSSENGPTIQTAAELFRDADQPDQTPAIKKYPVEAFSRGMLVNHPEYGAGKIVALEGNGKKSMATVEFFNGESKKFRLAQAPLAPAADNNQPDDEVPF